MKIFAALTLITYFLIASACSPVRGRYTAHSEDKAEQEAKQPTEEALIEEIPLTESRFSDTTEIIIPANPVNQTIPLDEQFQEAVREFDNEQYERACGKFRRFAETLPLGDSLYYESYFFVAECSIVRNELDHAEQILARLYGSEDLPDPVVQKVLVRLGQVYCVKGQPETAQALFDELKADYPESIYLQIANCDAVAK